jgi:integrase/recombinase XerD
MPLPRDVGEQRSKAGNGELLCAITQRRAAMRGEIDAFVQELEEQQASRERGVSRNTLMAYRSDLEQFLEYLERAGFDSWSVSALDVINYKRDLEQRYSKATTRARKLAAVKALYRYLVTTGKVAHDPARNLELPTPIKHVPETLSLDQLQRLIDSTRVAADAPAVEQAKASRDHAMLSLLCSTGLLASELVAIDLADFTPPATLGLGARTRRRLVAIDGPTGAALVAYIDQARPSLIHDSAEPALFVNHRGSRLTRQGFWLIIKVCATRAGIEGISPRLLRHSCAASQLTSGTELKKVQELLGHAHVSTTQAYVRARPTEAVS